MLASTFPLYTIGFPRHWFISDEPSDASYTRADGSIRHKSMIFHVSAGDYITTLATILRFFEESIHEQGITTEMRELQTKAISDVIDDLLYLDEHYTIVPKDK